MDCGFEPAFDAKRLPRQGATRAQGTKALVDDEDWEGACARAYYAMFNAAHAALEALSEKSPKSKTHQGLVVLFGQLLVKEGHFDADLGRSLNRVQQMRLTADYTGDEISKDDALSALADAEVFVETVHRKVSATNP